MVECKTCKRPVDESRQFVKVHYFYEGGQVDQKIVLCSGLCHSVFMMEDTHDCTLIYQTLDESWFPVIRQLRDQLKNYIKG